MLEVNLAPDLPKVFIEAKQIEQVILNLIPKRDRSGSRKINH